MPLKSEAVELVEIGTSNNSSLRTNSKNVPAGIGDDFLGRAAVGGLPERENPGKTTRRIALSKKDFVEKRLGIGTAD